MAHLSGRSRPAAGSVPARPATGAWPAWEGFSACRAGAGRVLHAASCRPRWRQRIEHGRIRRVFTCAVLRLAAAETDRQSASSGDRLFHGENAGYRGRCCSILSRRVAAVHAVAPETGSRRAHSTTMRRASSFIRHAALRQAVGVRGGSASVLAGAVETFESFPLPPPSGQRVFFLLQGEIRLMPLALDRPARRFPSGT